MVACGEEIFAVRKGPPVILDVGEFDAAGPGGFRDSEHFRDLLDVAAMNDEVECDGEAVLLEPFKDAKFLCVRFCVGDFGGGVFACALEAELDVVEAGVDERCEARFVHGKAGGDEIDVEAGGAGSFNEFDEIGAGQGFAAGEVSLKHPEVGGFAENAGPRFRGEFVRTGGEFEGIGAVDAVQRAAVG